MERIAKLDQREKDPDNAICLSAVRAFDCGMTIAKDISPGRSSRAVTAVPSSRTWRCWRRRSSSRISFARGDLRWQRCDRDKADKNARGSCQTVRTRSRPFDRIRQAPLYSYRSDADSQALGGVDKIKEVNSSLKRSCQAGQDLHFIATSQQVLNAEGGPMPELFKDDKLHQNAMAMPAGVN